MTNPNDSSFENAAIDPSNVAATEAPAPAPPDAEDAVAGAAEAVAAAQRLAAEMQDKYLRQAAEYDNFRKRSAKERLEAEHRGMGVLVKGMLDALDDLGRFAHVDPESVDAATVVAGADMVEKKLLKTLAGHGLEVVNPVDHPFDPALHEAITTTPALSEDLDHTVAQVFQVGYRFAGQLLRPARVVVRKWQG
ncbi:MAG: nucleotide exchange factor GrpE [Gemmatimonadetes bacterium]|nr:nucleotide exchange factor GrpE [Gemmatimonadota bacterium]